MNWTDSQSKAIEFPNSDVLVSAAAGSGKTATLTERVLRAVTNAEHPVDIRRMLIVTFTSKAAAELRQKIKKKLEERLSEEPDNAVLQRQLTLLPSADISTIHSFYIKILRKNFASLGLPPKIGVGDDKEFYPIRKSIMNDLIEAYYEGDVKGEYAIDDPEAFFGTFSSEKSDADIWETFSELYNKAASYREFLGYYKNCADTAKKAAEDFDSSPYYEYMRSYAIRKLVLYRDKILDLCDEYRSEDGFEEKYSPVFDQCLAYISEAIATYSKKGYAEARVFSAPKPAFSQLRGAPKDAIYAEASQNLKKEFVSKAISAIQDLFSFSPEQVKEICRKTAEVYLNIYKFLSNFDRLFIERKKKYKKFDYNDLERFCCDLLCDENGGPTKTAELVGKSYEAIFIDEYQDVNSTQDAIFAAISHNNRFMVGDIKQSIYGFRGAEPRIFAGYRKRAENKKEGEPIPDVLFLSDNFRCGKPVVDYTNLVFSKLFGADTEEVPYSEADALVFSKKAEKREDVKADIRIFTGANRKDGEKEYVAQRIAELVKSGTKDDGSPLTYGDIAILCRTESKCAEIEKKLKQRGIPVAAASKKSFFNSPEVILAVSLLTAIDNPCRDIPLAAVMKSPIFGFSEDELAVIRKSRSDAPFYEAVEAYAETDDGEKCRNFLARLQSLRKKSVKLPLEKFMRRLYSETAIMTLAFNKKDKNGKEMRKANLRKMYDLARDFGSDGTASLSDFAAYCDSLIKNDNEGVIVPSSAEEGCVTIMTMHKSKGLEYPAVFLYAVDSALDKSKTVVSDRTLGFAVTTVTENGPVKGPICETINKKYTDNGVRDDMRLLYVALTRAKKYLTVTAATPKTPSFGSRVSLELIMECKSLFDLLRLCTPEGETECSVCRVVEKEAEDTAADCAKETEEALYDGEFERKVRERLSFVYPHKALSGVPNKVAVSKLYPAMLDEDETVSDLEPDLPVPVILPGGEESEEKATAAKRGTATHLFMQFCDFESAEADVSAEAKRLSDKGFTDVRNAEIMYEEEVRSFFKSDLYNRMNAAKKAGRLFYREFRFNIGLDAAEFTNDPELKKTLENETLLVQGVVDCFFEEEDGTVTVCDYKTDRIGRRNVEDFKDRHRTQLLYYKKALERITKKKVGRLVLYSFCLGEEISL
ncbi:MAG: UvrD-helicase domain-containing protein [Clostridia bacterium]|nr:UvrD-helicase domain-containing protein [Clostridia bacterium]